MSCHGSRRDFIQYWHLQVPMDDEGILRFIINSYEINPFCWVSNGDYVLASGDVGKYQGVYLFFEAAAESWIHSGVVVGSSCTYLGFVQCRKAEEVVVAMLIFSLWWIEAVSSDINLLFVLGMLLGIDVMRIFFSCSSSFCHLTEYSINIVKRRKWIYQDKVWPIN